MRLFNILFKKVERPFPGGAAVIEIVLFGFSGYCKSIFNKFAEACGVKTSCGGYYHVIRLVELIHAARQRIPRERTDTFRIAENGHCQSVPAVIGFAKLLMRKILGRVLVHCDFFKHNALFTLNIARIKL